MIYWLIPYFLIGGWIAHLLWHMATHLPKSGRYRGPANALQWAVIVTFFLLWGPMFVAVVVYGLFFAIYDLFKQSL